MNENETNERDTDIFIFVKLAELFAQTNKSQQNRCKLQNIFLSKELTKHFETFLASFLFEFSVEFFSAENFFEVSIFDFDDPT